MKQQVIISVLLLLVGSQLSLAADMSTTGIRKRIAPIGQVTVSDNAATPAEGADDSKTARTGEEIYNSKCVVRHAAGIAGAPKLGDKVAWAPRLKKGKDTLLSSVTNGLQAMPPMGTCMDCTEADLKAAINYMLASVKD